MKEFVLNLLALFGLTTIRQAVENLREINGELYGARLTCAAHVATIKDLRVRLNENGLLYDPNVDVETNPDPLNKFKVGK